MAVISKGIELYFVKCANGMKPDGLTENVEGLGYRVPNLQEIGDLGTSASSERDKIEITTLADDEHKYTQGLLVESEYESIEFKLLYDARVYDAFLDIVNAERSYGEVFAAEGTSYIVTIPNGSNKASQFAIGATSSIKLDGVGVNSALTMTLTLTPVKEITFTM